MDIELWFGSCYADLSVVGEAVLVPEGWSPYVVVEPSYEDASNIIVLAYPQEDTFRKVFVYQDGYRLIQTVAELMG